jgi:hypothetical protein
VSDDRKGESGHVTIRLIHGASSGISVQHENRDVQQGGEGHPRGVGNEQRRSNAILLPGRDDEPENCDEQQEDDAECKDDPMGRREHRRPNEVQGELRQPQLHQPSGAIKSPGAPAGYGDENIEHSPHWREYPARRIERLFCQLRLPLAGCRDEADEEAAAHDQYEERE